MNGAQAQRAGNQSLTVKCQVSRVAVVCLTIVVLALLGRASFLEFRVRSEATFRELWGFVVLGGPRIFEIPNTGGGYSWFGWK